MDVYMELKRKYSTFQSEYSRMLKNIKNNNMNFQNSHENIVELNYIMDLMLLKTYDINMKLINTETCSNEQHSLLEDFKENEEILKTMFPLFLSLKMAKQVSNKL